MTSHICECCDEREAVTNNGTQWLCLECVTPQCCSHCDRELTDGENDGWTLGDDANILCIACQSDTNDIDMLDELEASVESLAKLHGWTVASRDKSAETRSRYITLARGDMELKVRVSDHATAYCSEDISLCTKNASGDDHTIADLSAALQR